MSPEILIAALAAAAVLLITYGVAARPSEDAVQARLSQLVVQPKTLEEMELKAATVAKMIDASYVLTYMPKVPFGERGGERNISVTSKRPGLVVQANRKFIVPPRKG